MFEQVFGYYHGCLEVDEGEENCRKIIGQMTVTSEVKFFVSVSAHSIIEESCTHVKVQLSPQLLKEGLLVGAILEPVTIQSTELCSHLLGPFWHGHSYQNIWQAVRALSYNMSARDCTRHFLANLSLINWKRLSDPISSKWLFKMSFRSFNVPASRLLNWGLKTSSSAGAYCPKTVDNISQRQGFPGNRLYPFCSEPVICADTANSAEESWSSFESVWQSWLCEMAYE